MYFKILSISCCVLLSAGFARGVAAQDALTLDEAVIRVLENHPRLRVADYEARATAARLRQALQSPADRLTVTLENFAGTGEAAAVRGLEATLSLSRTLELGNKTGLRGDVVREETRLVRNRNDLERLNLLADAAQRFLRVAADQERLRLAGEAVELARMTETAVMQRVEAGRTPEAERQRVAIALANQMLELEHARHELAASRMNLATLWNVREPDFARVEAGIYQLGEPPDFEVINRLLDRNPELIQYLQEDDLARARIKLMQSRRKPDVDVAAGVRYLGGTNDFALMLWSTIPLGTAGRAAPAIDEAEALAGINPLILEQRRLELYATLFGIYQEMNHALETVRTLNDRVIPSAERMLDAYESGYQSGRYSLLELIQVQQQLHEARLRLLESAAAYHGQKIEIDRLTGAQLTQW